MGTWDELWVGGGRSLVTHRRHPWESSGVLVRDLSMHAYVGYEAMNLFRYLSASYIRYFMPYVSGSAVCFSRCLYPSRLSRSITKGPPQLGSRTATRLALSYRDCD